MKVSVSGMSRNCIDNIVFVLVQNCIEFRQKLRKIFGSDDYIIYERCCFFAFHIFPQKTKTFSPYYPILLSIGTVFCDSCFNFKFIVDFFSALFNRVQQSCLFIGSKFHKHNHFRNTPGQNRPNVGKKFKHSSDTHFFDQVGEHFHCQFKSVVVIRLKAFRIIFINNIHNLSQRFQVL